MTASEFRPASHSVNPLRMIALQSRKPGLVPPVFSDQDVAALLRICVLLRAACQLVKDRAVRRTFSTRRQRRIKQLQARLFTDLCELLDKFDQAHNTAREQQL